MDASDTLTTAVDSNVVADIDSSGVYFAYSGYYNRIAITHNLLSAARRDGVRILGYGTAVATGNNISSNLPFGVNVLADIGAINGTGNWWGDALGPRCSSGCNPASAGDSVPSGFVNFTGFLTAPSDTVPPLPVPAPRVLARALPAPVVPLRTASDATVARFRHAERFAADAARPRPRAPGGPLAARQAAEERQREQSAAERAARLRDLRLRAEARESARRAAQTSPRVNSRQGVRP